MDLLDAKMKNTLISKTYFCLPQVQGETFELWPHRGTSLQSLYA